MVIIFYKKYKRLIFYHHLNIQAAHKYILEIKNKEET